jgi:tetratricopeptide (TPR) repeat protein
MIIVLDNAESILDPQGADAQEIYAVVEELSQFGNICLCITSRITTIPSNCKTLDIPTLSMEAALNTFYQIHQNTEQSDLVCKILEQLDFHPLSTTLLATVACHNKWDTSRLIREWERQRTAVLHTKHSKSLAATIELSLSSPTFQELGPDAHDLLRIIAFFPQGVDENNLDWLFPTTSNRTDIFDTFCILSLAYRSNGFITMLAPLRDHLSPKDPTSSPLLCTTKNQYFSRLSIEIYPGKPGFDEAQWIKSEDVNVEHLLDIFTDANLDDAWAACHHFMEHLVFHKQRLVTLGPKIRGLPDDHPSKPKCLFQLSKLFFIAGKFVESKQLFIRTLQLWREQGDDSWVARTLGGISLANQELGLIKEGIQQLKEALEICEQLGDISGQARSLCQLACLLGSDRQFDAAEVAALQVIDRFSGKDEQCLVCKCYRVLGTVCHIKGKTEEAIDHLNAALGIASFNWNDEVFFIHCGLAQVFFDQGRFDDAHAHIEHAKSYTVDIPYLLAWAVKTQALYWYRQQRFEEARSAASYAANVYERLGATLDADNCRTLLQDILQDIEQAAKC